MAAPDPSSKRRLRRGLLLGALALLVLWLAFFDSHSLLQRYQWHQEYEELAAENTRLEHEIRVLQERLQSPLPDSVVIQIAREQYGMKRPNETVYPLRRH